MAWNNKMSFCIFIVCAFAHEQAGPLYTLRERF